jgi:hypothetical protein
MMEAIYSSETTVPSRATRRHIPGDGILLKMTCTGNSVNADLVVSSININTFDNIKADNMGLVTST